MKIIDKLVKAMVEIEDALERGELDKIDLSLEYIAVVDDLTMMENEMLVLWLRSTYMFRDKLQYWISARDRVEQILNDRDLDGKHILRGLYEQRS